MNHHNLSTIAVLRRAEADAHSALVDAARAGVSPAEQNRLRTEWLTAAETFLRECDSRSAITSQVLLAAVEGER